MTTIRLTRMGRNKKPFYRIVVTDSRKRRDSGWIESIGYYNPVSKPKELKFDEKRLEYWIGVGAKMSDRVQRLTGKIIDKNLKRKLSSNTPKQKSEKELQRDELRATRAKEAKEAEAEAKEAAKEEAKKLEAKESSSDEVVNSEAKQEETKEDK